MEFKPIPQQTTPERLGEASWEVQELNRSKHESGEEDKSGEEVNTDEEPVHEGEDRKRSEEETSNPSETSGWHASSPQLKNQGSLVNFLVTRGKKTYNIAKKRRTKKEMEEWRKKDKESKKKKKGKVAITSWLVLGQRESEVGVGNLGDEREGDGPQGADSES
jgi:hypothetical protein